MRQQLFSWGDDFVIKDEMDQPCFQVDGKVFTIGKQLDFLDLAGQPLAHISQKIFAWGPTFEIYRSGQLFATVKKKLFTFFNCTFDIDLPGPNDLVAKGDFMDMNYEIIRNDGGVVATISKKWFSWTDSYGVEIAPGNDDVLLLACTVVIDMACHEQDD